MEECNIIEALRAHIIARTDIVVVEPRDIIPPPEGFLSYISRRLRRLDVDGRQLPKTPGASPSVSSTSDYSVRTNTSHVDGEGFKIPVSSPNTIRMYKNQLPLHNCENPFKMMAAGRKIGRASTEVYSLYWKVNGNVKDVEEIWSPVISQVNELENEHVISVLFWMEDPINGECTLLVRLKESKTREEMVELFHVFDSVKLFSVEHLEGEIKTAKKAASLTVHGAPIVVGRDDLDVVLNLVKEKKLDYNFLRAYCPDMLKRHGDIIGRTMLKIIPADRMRPKVLIYCLIGDPGTGKTTWVKKRHSVHGVEDTNVLFNMQPDSQWWDGLSSQPVLTIDEWRGYKAGAPISSYMMNCLIQSGPTRVAIKGSSLWSPSVVIYVISNHALAYSSERTAPCCFNNYIQRSSFMRRLHFIGRFEKDKDPSWAYGEAINKDQPRPPLPTPRYVEHYEDLLTGKRS